MSTAPKWGCFKRAGVGEGRVGGWGGDHFRLIFPRGVAPCCFLKANLHLLPLLVAIWPAHFGPERGWGEGGMGCGGGGGPGQPVWGIEPNGLSPWFRADRVSWAAELYE